MRGTLAGSNDGPAYDLDPDYRLAVAVIAQALKDAAAGGEFGPEARAWLDSEDARTWARLLGLDAWQWHEIRERAQWDRGLYGRLRRLAA